MKLEHIIALNIRFVILCDLKKKCLLYFPDIILILTPWSCPTYTKTNILDLLGSES